MRERRRETQMTRLARETRKTDETRNARLTRGMEETQRGGKKGVRERITRSEFL